MSELAWSLLAFYVLAFLPSVLFVLSRVRRAHDEMREMREYQRARRVTGGGR